MLIVDNNRRTRRWLLFSICAVSLVVTTLIPAQPMVQAGNPSDSLKLTIAVEKTNVVLGEPVYVTVRLRNTGSSPAKVFKNLRPEVGVAQVDVTAPDGRTFGFVPLAIIDTDEPLGDLAPGEEVSAVFALFYGARGWTFQRPGKYTLVAKYQDPTHRKKEALRSNSVTVSVTQVDGAGEFLMKGDAGREAGKFLVWQAGDHLRKGIAHLKDLIEKFPNSPLVDYAQLALGNNLGKSFRDYSIGRVRRPDCGTALAHLQKVRSDRLPTYLKVRKNLAQARCHLRLQQPEQAQKLMRATQDLVGERTEFRFLFDQAIAVEPKLKLSE